MDLNKDLIAASSTPLVLAILAEGDSYGYAILQRVRDLSAGRMTWTDGMLYPVLHRLERLGHIESRWESAESGRKRKYYRITAQGHAQLAEERRQWQAVDSTLRGIWGAVAMPPLTVGIGVGTATGTAPGSWRSAHAANTAHAARRPRTRYSTFHFLTPPLALAST